MYMQIVESICRTLGEILRLTILATLALMLLIIILYCLLGKWRVAVLFFFGSGTLFIIALMQLYTTIMRSIALAETSEIIIGLTLIALAIVLGVVSLWIGIREVQRIKKWTVCGANTPLFFLQSTHNNGFEYMNPK